MSHNLNIGKALAFATIEIFNPNSTASVYDAATNTWSGTTTILWSGSARIQPRNATASRTNSPVDPGSNQVIEMNIGLRENQVIGSNGVMPDLRPGYKVRVTSSPYDPTMVNFDFVIRAVLNSSNPWNRQILCEVNEELNPNNVV